MQLKRFQGHSHIAKTLSKIMNFVSDKYILVKPVVT